MKTKPIIDRIAASVSGLAEVGTPSDLISRLRSTLRATPAAYVALLSETPSGNTLINAISQRVTVRFGVTVVGRDTEGPSGEPATDLIDDIRNQIISALVGWQPAPGYDPIEYGGGNLDATTDNLILFTDEFETKRLIRFTG